jgi:hypothetical protein
VIVAKRVTANQGRKLKEHSSTPDTSTLPKPASADKTWNIQEARLTYEPGETNANDEHVRDHTEPSGSKDAEKKPGRLEYGKKNLAYVLFVLTLCSSFALTRYRSTKSLRDFR